MASTLHRHRVLPARMTLVLLASLGFLLPVAPVATAAVTAPNYSTVALTYADATTVQTCRGWGGDADDDGHFYLGCPVQRDNNGDGIGDEKVPALYELDQTGRVMQIGYLPSEYHFDDLYPIRDVGVAPNGRTAYISVGPNTDNLGQHPEINPTTGAVMANGAKTGSLLRMTRQVDGSWAHDPTFAAGPFLLGGSYWAARYVDVDSKGRIYVSVNAYVYELNPATGAIISAFGGATTNGPGGPWIEGFDNAAGITISADGSTLYLVDQQFHLVQRWLRVGATDWARDLTFLLGRDEEGDGLCATNDHFQSPYDVGLDGAGDVYVMDTTCQRIQRFTKTGAFVQTVWNNVGGDDLNHGFGVNWQGSIVLPIEERVLVRSDPPAKPPAIVDAPTPKLRARTVARLGGAGCSTAALGTRVPAAARYRVVDRCARFSGRVMAVKQAGRGWSIEVMLPLQTARAIYTNATGPVRITILTDRRTRILRTVRTGRFVSVLSTLVVGKAAGSPVRAMPVDQLAGG